MVKIQRFPNFGWRSLGLITVFLCGLLTTTLTHEADKRRLGSALNAGRMWERPQFKMASELGAGDKARQDVESEFESVAKRGIGAALDKLSHFRYPAFLDSKRRLGPAKNAKYGTWYYKTDSKRGLGSALNQGYWPSAQYNLKNDLEKRSLGSALAAARSDLLYRLVPDGRVVNMPDNTYKSKEDSGDNEGYHLGAKRHLGSALNAAYKSDRNKRSFDGLLNEDGLPVVQFITPGKTLVEPHFNANFGLTKAKYKEQKNSLTGNEQVADHLEVAPSTLEKRHLGAALSMKSRTDSIEDTPNEEKRRIGAALNSMSRKLHHNVINKLPKSENKQTVTKRRLGAALNVKSYKQVNYPKEEKRRIGTVLNALANDLQNNVINKNLVSGNDKSSKDQTKYKKTTGEDKRRIGSALNAKYKTWKLYPGDDQSQTKDHNKRQNSALNSRDKAIDDQSHSEIEKRRIGSALDALDKHYLIAYQKEAGQPGLGSTFNTDYKPHDKRGLGSAFNPKYKTWYYKTGKNKMASEIPEDTNMSYEADDTVENVDVKRRLGAAVQSRHRGRMLNRGLQAEKRRLGAALNARYQGYKAAYVKARRRRSIIGLFQDSDVLNLHKRFLGAALNVRFRNGGSSSRYSGLHSFRPRGRRDIADSELNIGMNGGLIQLQEKDAIGQADGARINDVYAKENGGDVKNTATRPKDNSEVYDDQRKRRIGAALESLYRWNSNQNKDVESSINSIDKQEEKGITKRHLGSLVSAGSPFPMTKFSPSRYLPKLDSQKDMLYYQNRIGQKGNSKDMSKARMYKFFG